MDDHESIPIIATDDSGMILDDQLDNSQQSHRRSKQSKRPYRSKHFPTRKINDATVAQPTEIGIKKLKTPDFSSDSSLTDVPSDIGSDPFVSDDHAVNGSSGKAKRLTKSPYFPGRHRSAPVSCIPFPPLSATKFGLMQERLAHDPFRLLIATIFLNRTKGEHAMPVFCQLMDAYPTIEQLANANVEDVVQIVHKLGFQNQRARKCIQVARAWLGDRPIKGRRHRKLNYPVPGDGRDILPGEVVEDEDDRIAWEISHLPGLGPYSHDSWRIFCRDRLRGLSQWWNGEGAGPGFEPEWKRVLPTDKELRAYLTWMWLKEGWIWNKETGERAKADEHVLEKAHQGGVIQEDEGKNYLSVRRGNELVQESQPPPRN